jgi:hypothetical protein
MILNEIQLRKIIRKKLIEASILDTVQSSPADYFEKSLQKFSAGQSAIKQIKNVKDAAKMVENLFNEIKELNPEIDLEMVAKIILKNEQSKKVNQKQKSNNK